METIRMKNVGANIGKVCHCIENGLSEERIIFAVNGSSTPLL